MIVAAREATLTPVSVTLADTPLVQLFERSSPSKCDRAPPVSVCD